MQKKKWLIFPSSLLRMIVFLQREKSPLLPERSPRLKSITFELQSEEQCLKILPPQHFQCKCVLSFPSSEIQRGTLLKNRKSRGWFSWVLFKTYGMHVRSNLKSYLFLKKWNHQPDSWALQFAVKCNNSRNLHTSIYPASGVQWLLIEAHFSRLQFYSWFERKSLSFWITFRDASDILLIYRGCNVDLFRKAFYRYAC